MPLAKTDFGIVQFEENDDPEAVAEAIAEHLKPPQDPVRDALLLLIKREAETRQILEETCQVLRQSLAASREAMLMVKQGHAEMKQGLVDIIETLQKPVVPKYDSRGKLIAAQRM